MDRFLNSEDQILIMIDQLKKNDRNMPQTELGYFNSMEDKAYRNEAVRKAFTGLNRKNQDAALNISFLCSGSRTKRIQQLGGACNLIG